MKVNSFYSIEDTTFFKGIGIILIFIHNYFHVMPGFNIENEQNFDRKNITLLFYHLKQFTFTEVFGALISFFGHYGVQIFIIFSAYGLSIQYNRSKKSPLNFTITKLKKLYFLMFIGILFVIVFYFLFTDIRFTFREIIEKTFLLMTSLSSFSDLLLYKMFVGPFWFFALMVQLYILFPLLYFWAVKLNKKKYWIIFLLSYLMIYPLFYWTNLNSFTLFGNILGHLPEVFLGIGMARFGYNKFPWWMFFLATLIFLCSQFLEILFPLSFLMICIILISIINVIRKHSRNGFEKFILFTGKISMILFIVNGPLRKIPYFIHENNNIRTLRFLPFIIILYLLSYLIYRLYKLLEQLIFKNNT